MVSGSPISSMRAFAACVAFVRSSSDFCKATAQAGMSGAGAGAGAGAGSGAGAGAGSGGMSGAGAGAGAGAGSGAGAASAASKPAISCAEYPARIKSRRSSTVNVFTLFRHVGKVEQIGEMHKRFCIVIKRLRYCRHFLFVCVFLVDERFPEQQTAGQFDQTSGGLYSGFRERVLPRNICV